MKAILNSFKNHCLAGIHILVGILAAMLLLITVIGSLLAYQNFNRLMTDQIPFSEAGIEEPRPIESGDIGLESELAYLKSRLLTAGQDSISLWVDLKDSLVQLAIRGVVVHEARIRSIDLDACFKNAHYQGICKNPSSPLSVDHHHASIKKHPVVVKKAPADTSEVEATSFLPDTSFRRAAIAFSFYTRQGYKLQIRQQNIRSLDEFFGMVSYNLKESFMEILKLSGKYPDGQKVFYYPEIRIRISKNDAQVIYRALPDNPLISIQF